MQCATPLTLRTWARVSIGSREAACSTEATCTRAKRQALACKSTTGLSLQECPTKPLEKLDKLKNRLLPVSPKRRPRAVGNNSRRPLRVSSYRAPTASGPGRNTALLERTMRGIDASRTRPYGQPACVGGGVSESSGKKTLLPCFAPAAGLPLESLTLLLLLVGGRSDGE